MLRVEAGSRDEGLRYRCPSKAKLANCREYLAGPEEYSSLSIAIANYTVTVLEIMGNGNDPPALEFSDVITPKVNNWTTHGYSSGYRTFEREFPCLQKYPKN